MSLKGMLLGKRMLSCSEIKFENLLLTALLEYTSIYGLK